MSNPEEVRLTESELALLGVLILRAIEQGKPITGLFVQEPNILADIVHSPENAANAVSNFTNRLAEEFPNVDRAERTLARRALSMDPTAHPLNSLNGPEALLKRLARGSEVDLG